MGREGLCSVTDVQAFMCVERSEVNVFIQPFSVLRQGSSLNLNLSFSA